MYARTLVMGCVYGLCILCTWAVYFFVVCCVYCVYGVFVFFLYWRRILSCGHGVLSSVHELYILYMRWGCFVICIWAVCMLCIWAVYILTFVYGVHT